MNEKPPIESGAAKIVSLADETKFAANGIVSRTLLRTAYARTVLFGFAEGQELSEHTSTQHALIQILTGECQFSLAGQRHSLTAGDFLYLPPNLPHAVRATTQFSMLLTLTKPEITEKIDAFLTAAKPNRAPTLPLNNHDSLEPEKIFDGRSIPCSAKHGRIIQTWLALEVGDYFVLRNDHDPARLRDQFASQWPQAFSWEYLVNGPDEFQVKITKLAPAAPPVAEVECCNGH